MRRRSLLTVALAGLVSMAASSCLSPTLPLPPPDHPNLIQAGTEPGTWVVAGDCPPNAFVTVVNQKTGRGEFTQITQDGHYQVTVDGAQCDFAKVFFVEGLDATEATGFDLAPFMRGDPQVNPLCQP
jgi:hypothetical protein